MPVECTCDLCVEACKRNPGWFAPGEAELTAKAMGVPWEEFKKSLIIDYWCAGLDGDDVFAWSPRKTVDDPDKVAGWGRPFHSGDCVFLKDNRCTIHKAKPHECREVTICKKTGRYVRKEVAEMWREAGNPLKKEAGDV